MIAFIILAAVLAAACVTIIAVPLLKGMPSGTPRAPFTAVAATWVLAAGSVGFYATWSNWSWHKSPGVASPEGMVEKLVHRLNDHPEDLDGWLMLGRSYVALQEYPLAVRAYERADQAAAGHSSDALIGEADALMQIDDTQVTGQAGALIERALAIDPSSPKALFFGAAVALRRGDLPLARARFSKLLGMNPPDDVKAILEQEISGIDSKLAADHADPSPKSP